jgi:hypothetical protein
MPDTFFDDDLEIKRARDTLIRQNGFGIHCRRLASCICHISPRYERYGTREEPKTWQLFCNLTRTSGKLSVSRHDSHNDLEIS